VVVLEATCPREASAMPSTRYTVRLPPALDAAVQDRVRQGTPFAVLIREALAAYLADTPPTGVLTAADRAPTPADTMQELQEQLAALTRRVAALEQAPTPRRQAADRRADRALTPADRLPTGADRGADTVPPSADTPEPPRRPGRGRLKLTPRQVRALRDKHLRGVPVPALMEEYGVSKASVFRYLRSSKRREPTP
jgi:hypothetical protein